MGYCRIEHFGKGFDDQRGPGSAPYENDSADISCCQGGLAQRLANLINGAFREVAYHCLVFAATNLQIEVKRFAIVNMEADFGYPNHAFVRKPDFDLFSNLAESCSERLTAIPRIKVGGI